MADETNWWHVVEHMSDNDLDLLPFGFMKKYGTFVKSMIEHEKMVATEESKEFENRFEHVRLMNKLLTNEEKRQIEEFKADNLIHGENELDNYEMTGYLSR